MRPRASALRAVAGLAAAALAWAGAVVAKAPPPSREVEAEAGLLDAAFLAAFQARGSAKRPTPDGSYLLYRPYRIVRLGRTAALLSIADGEGCHACSGGFAIHYLKPGTKGLRLTGAWPEIVPGSSSGEPPRISLRTDLFAYPAVVSARSWAGMGCSNTYVDLIELTPARPIVRAEQVLLDYRQEKEFPGERRARLSGRIRPEAGGRSFAVDYRGDKTFTIRRSLGKGEAFRIAGRSRKLPGC